MTRTPIIIGAVGVLILAGAAVLGVVTRPKQPSSEDTERAARAWVDRLGIRVTGVVCEGTACTIAPEQGPPFKARCNPTCHLAD